MSQDLDLHCTHFCQYFHLLKPHKNAPVSSDDNTLGFSRTESQFHPALPCTSVPKVRFLTLATPLLVSASCTTFSTGGTKNLTRSNFEEKWCIVAHSPS